MEFNVPKNEWVMVVCLNGLNPHDYMFMGKKGSTYSFKHIDTREYVYLKEIF